MADPAGTRGSILMEVGEIVTAIAFAGAQHVMRIHAPRIAAMCKPGQFVHLRCAPELMMRRPMSIMRADVHAGWIEILFKVHGIGTRALAAGQARDEISLIGPIGQPFKLQDYRRRTLLISGGVGIPPMVFLAEHLLAQNAAPLVIMGSEAPFPFRVRPSQILVPGLPAEVIGTMPLLEDWGVACRLASQQCVAGCFDGLVTELAEHWIRYQQESGDGDIEIFACGPTPMLKAVAELAGHYRAALPGLTRRIYGLWGWWLRGMRGCRTDRSRAGDETGVRRRTRVRGRRYRVRVRRLAAAW